MRLLSPYRPVAVCAALLFASGALAAEAFYLGTWKIASAVPAPWAVALYSEDQAVAKSLVGKTITISPTGITGPQPMGCRGPRYKVLIDTAEMLFEGSFGEMRDRDKSVDPAKLAAKLGFQGSSWKTLRTGCANEVDFHFLNPATAAFGLDNFVYTLKKD